MKCLLINSITISYSLSNNALCINPATIAPVIGATQNNQDCVKYSPPANKAWLIERAGFTEVFVIGILIK